MNRIFKQESKYVLNTTILTSIDYYIKTDKGLFCVDKYGVKSKSDYSWKEFKDIKYRYKNIGYYNEVIQSK